VSVRYFQLIYKTGSCNIINSLNFGCLISAESDLYTKDFSMLILFRPVAVHGPQIKISFNEKWNLSIYSSWHGSWQYQPQENHF
jgi:hypothetical protein